MLQVSWFPTKPCLFHFYFPCQLLTLPGHPTAEDASVWNNQNSFVYRDSYPHSFAILRHFASGLLKTTMALKGNTGSLQPWYKRRASARTVSARSILRLSSFVLITLSFALFVVINATVPAAGDISLFYVQAAYISYNNANPVLKLGTFGYCIDWAPDDLE